jgi:hypothetical protein
MDFEPFAPKDINFIFFDDTLCGRQSDRKDSQDFIDSSVGLRHAGKK